MFKKVAYRKFLDPWKNNIYAYPPPLVSDSAFRIAVTEAYRQLSDAIDQHTAARMRRQSRVGVAGLTSRAEVKAAELVGRRRQEILDLLAGLLRVCLPHENAAAHDRAKELCHQANERAQGTQGKARLQSPLQIKRGGFPAPTSRKNAAKRSR